jgi:biopolymer transport protein ExbD
MQFRNQKSPEKIEPQMAPMIDVVFLLLIFFMLTLKIISPEGDFNINMPAVAQAQTETPKLLPDFKVRLLADVATGQLIEVRFGQRSLGTGPRAFLLLQQTIKEQIAGSPYADEIEIEIDADFDLNYEHVISAVSACTGEVSGTTADGGTPKISRFVEKIKFAPPRQSLRAPVGG